MYLLDANTYIQAKNHHYQMNVVPGFWQWLDVKFEEGYVASVGMVSTELKTYGDELSDWVRSRSNHFYTESDDATQNKFIEIAQFLAAGDYNEANRDEFLAGADPWLIAKAKTMGATVVSHEAMVPANSKKVKVPNICREFEVSCIDAFALLRVLEAKFVLEETE